MTKQRVCESLSPTDARGIAWMCVLPEGHEGGHAAIFGWGSPDRFADFTRYAGLLREALTPAAKSGVAADRADRAINRAGARLARKVFP